jgi:hypothetical protein
VAEQLATVVDAAAAAAGTEVVPVAGPAQANELGDEEIGGFVGAPARTGLDGALRPYDRRRMATDIDCTEGWQAPVVVLSKLAGSSGSCWSLVGWHTRPLVFVFWSHQAAPRSWANALVAVSQRTGATTGASRTARST